VQEHGVGAVDFVVDKLVEHKENPGDLEREYVPSSVEAVLALKRYACGCNWV
jgi:hypothetical protein